MVREEDMHIAKLGSAEKQDLIAKLLHNIEDDNELFLRKLRERIDRVGIRLPEIEVRYEHLVVEADVRVGSRALPTLYNFMINLLEEIFSYFVPLKKKKLNILHDLNGIIKSSRMTLLLGPPSSGKTTLLLVLTGRLAPDLRVSGKLTYNGHEMTEFVPQRTSAYVSQDDVQLAELTVRETLDFCGCCQGVRTRYDMLMEILKRENEDGIKPDPDIDAFMKAAAMEGLETNIVTDYVLKILGLDICTDTIIGDQMRRGISRGQQKRVTIGEMLVGPIKALFMDDILTGLDSSTAFQIMKCMQQAAHLMDATMLVSLLQPLQPAPETYELFDDLILLSEGHIVYQGPRDLVLEFFRSMGFKCPERKSVPDFLQEVISRKDQAHYWEDQSQPHRFVSGKEFSEAFKSFHVGQRLKADLAIPYNKSKSHPDALSTKRFGIPRVALFKACISRDWLLMKRNSFLHIFKTCQVTLVSIVAMTVFLRTNLRQGSVADGHSYLGALFYGLTVIMFNGLSEMAMVVIRLPVFSKEREQLLYPAWAYSIPTMIIRLPLSMLECLIWVCLTYFVIGFSPEPSRFFRQLLMLFCVSQAALGLFRLLGAVGRSMIMASTFGAFALMVTFVMGGIVISKDQINKCWIWAYWISPLMYGQNGLVLNEFLANRWSKPYNGSIEANTVGKAILKAHGFFTEERWYWISIGALIGIAILFNVLFTIALTYLKPLPTSQASLSDADSKKRHFKHIEKNLQLPQAASVGLSNGTEGPECIPNLKESKSFSEASNGFDDADLISKHRKRGMVLPFQALSIAFNSINYSIDMPFVRPSVFPLYAKTSGDDPTNLCIEEMKRQGNSGERLQLLQDVSGAFRPGILTAVMGVSGAGKTTLMDVLAGRKTSGYIEGEVSISGFPKKQETYARISGYCEQNDSHSPNLTVKESLIFSAWLRLPKEVDKQTRMMFVEEVMELVELSPIEDSIVGMPGVNGLLTGQRKRLTIAVELVANPSIIFMDEPTSGLDAQAAAIVMRTVCNMVKTGRTVVCTIHQPSVDIFEAFDELLLLKRGGKTIYTGPLGHNTSNLIEYFQAIPGVPPIREGSNPATWMLDITSPSAEDRFNVDFAETFKMSPLHQQTLALVKELSVPQPGSKDLSFATIYNESFLEQCWACLWKQHRSYWRNPYYNAVRILFTASIGLLFGTVFWGLGHKLDTIQDLFNIIGALYATTLFLGFSNLATVEPVVSIERTVFYRERGSAMYSALPYAFAQATIEVPYVFIQTLIYVLLVYSMMGFEWTAVKFFYFLFFMFFTLLYFTYYGMMSVAITPSLPFATIVSSAFFTFWNLFSGFIVPRRRIPIWWRWYSWGDPIQWSIYGLLTSQLGNIETEIQNPDVAGKRQQSVRKYMKNHLGYDHDFLGVVAAVHLGLTFIFLFVFTLGIKKLNFQKR